MTLAAPTLLNANSSATDAATYNTASTTPALGARVVVVVQTGKSGNASIAPTSVTHPSIGSLAKVLEVSTPTGNNTLSIWTGVGTGSAGAFAITHSSVQENCIWQIISVTSNVATPTVRQSNVLSTGSSGSQGATLPSTPLTSSCVIGAYAENNAADAATVGSGFIALGSRATQSSPAAAMWAEYDLASPPAKAAFTFSASIGKALGAVEIADGVIVTPTGPTANVWNGTVEQEATLSIWDGSTELPVTIN